MGKGTEVEKANRIMNAALDELEELLPKKLGADNERVGTLANVIAAASTVLEVEASHRQAAATEKLENTVRNTQFYSYH